MWFASLLLPVAASAAVLQERQGLGGLFSGGKPTTVISEQLQPQYRKTANRNLYKVGPFNLTGSVKGGRDSTFGGQGFWPNLAPGSFCNKPGQSCTVLAGKVGLAFAGEEDIKAGKKASPENGIYIHHILTSDKTKVETPWISNCGSKTRPVVNIAGLLGGTAFVGTGEDSSADGALYTTEDGAQDSGFHIGENDRFSAWAQIVNYNPEWKMIYVTYDLEWVPGKLGDDVKTATLTATCGGSPVIKLSESGPTTTNSTQFTFLQSGQLLGGRGHLHDGGVQMDLSLNGRYLCSSEAIYGEATESTGMAGGHSHGDRKAAPGAPAAGGAASGMSGMAGMAGMGHSRRAELDAPKPGTAAIKTITGMTTCKGPFEVKKGDTLSMAAVYDLKRHPLRVSLSGSKAADVMGMWGISFAASRTADKPA